MVVFALIRRSYDIDSDVGGDRGASVGTCNRITGAAAVPQLRGAIAIRRKQGRTRTVFPPTPGRPKGTDPAIRADGCTGGWDRDWGGAIDARHRFGPATAG